MQSAAKHFERNHVSDRSKSPSNPSRLRRWLSQSLRELDSRWWAWKINRLFRKVQREMKKDGTDRLPPTVLPSQYMPRHPPTLPDID